MRDARDPRDVLVIVGPWTEDNGAGPADDAPQRAIERRDDRRVLRRAGRVDDEQVGERVIEPGRARRDVAEQRADFVARRVEALLEQEPANEDGPAEIGDARRLEAVDRLAAGDAVDAHGRVT